VIALRLSCPEKADAWAVRVGALSLSALVLLVPAVAGADIYTWTDEQGNTVISDVRPNPKKVTSVQVVTTDARPAAGTSRIPAQQAATPTEQVLLDRVRNLELQLQAQQRYPPAPPPQPYYGDYPAPPPPPDDYGHNDYYPGYYPRFGYSYPLVTSYSYIVRPRNVHPARGFASRPAVGFSHGGSFHGGTAHTGRR
jgi:hypothetical protein